MQQLDLCIISLVIPSQTLKITKELPNSAEIAVFGLKKFMANINQDHPFSPFINRVDPELPQAVEVIGIDSDSSIEDQSHPILPTCECSICLETDLEVDQHFLGC